MIEALRFSTLTDKDESVESIIFSNCDWTKDSHYYEPHTTSMTPKILFVMQSKCASVQLWKHTTLRFGSNKKPYYALKLTFWKN